MHDNSIAISAGNHFDDVIHTQGGTPHLVQYLWDRYVSHLETQIKERAARGEPVVSLAEAKKKAPATHFATWAADYLRQNRVVEHFFIDENHGIRLSNNACVAVSPGTIIRGTMQSSHAVEITSGLSQTDMNGVIESPSLQI